MPTVDSSFPSGAANDSGVGISSPFINTPTAASAATMPMDWDTATIRSELKTAVMILSHCGLKLSCKWACEQLLGLEENTVAATPSVHSNKSTADTSSSLQEEFLLLLSNTADREWYAKSLLELGEYLHAAAVLSEEMPDNGSNPCQIAGALPDLTPFGIFLRAYALYMAGERRKEEDVLELREPLERTSVTNPYLPQLRKELADYHKTNELDAFGLYAYGMVLKAGASLETQQKQAIAVLLESLKLFPHNWSAWLDIASLCEDNVDLYYDFIQPEITNMPSLNTHYMYAFFTAHMMLETQNYQESVMILDKLHHNPHSDTVLFASPFLLSKIAVNYYQLRDFATAANYFGTLVQLDPHRLEHMDVYSNILYVAEDRPNLSKLAHWAMKLDKYRPETCCIVGNYYSLLGQRTKAVSYFQRALKLDSSYTSAWTLMGHEFVELKNTAAAMECYRRAVDVSPQDYRAWYGLGQTYELLNMHLYALFYYRKAATLRRYDARMWCAIGGCYQLLGRKEDAIRSYQRAVSNNDREGIATQKLAALYRNDGKMEEAAQCYMRHLQLRYQATVSREPDEEAATPPLNTLINSVALEEAVAEALLFLSNYYRDHGEYETAALCCSRLLEYPGPEKEEGKALLREIRSRRERSSAAAGGPESPRRLSIRGRHEESGRRGRDDSSMSMDFSP